MLIRSRNSSPTNRSYSLWTKSPSSQACGHHKQTCPASMRACYFSAIVRQRYDSRGRHLTAKIFLSSGKFWRRFLSSRGSTFLQTISNFQAWSFSKRAHFSLITHSLKLSVGLRAVPQASIHCATDIAHDVSWILSGLANLGRRSKWSKRRPRPIQRDVKSYAGRTKTQARDGTTLDSVVGPPSSWPNRPSEVSYRSENT